MRTTNSSPEDATTADPAHAGGGRRPSRARPPELIDVSEGWAETARCREEDAALFFGPNRFEPKRERLAREAAAKSVCRTCPALAACREHAVANREAYGVWGGLGENDRRALFEDAGTVATAV